MLALTSHYLWYSSRATGIVSLLLLTIVMVLGISTSTRIGTGVVPRFAIAEIHRRISLLSLIFLAIHILGSVLDSYVNISFLSVIIPFTSHYKPFKVALGTIALDLMIAIIITSLVRAKMSFESWRLVHWLSFLAFVIAVVHTIMIGTDFRFAWMDLFVFACVAAVGGALLWRIWQSPRRHGLGKTGPGSTALNRRAAADHLTSLRESKRPGKPVKRGQR